METKRRTTTAAAASTKTSDIVYPEELVKLRYKNALVYIKKYELKIAKGLFNYKLTCLLYENFSETTYTMATYTIIYLYIQGDSKLV